MRPPLASSELDARCSAEAVVRPHVPGAREVVNGIEPGVPPRGVAADVVVARTPPDLEAEVVQVGDVFSECVVVGHLDEKLSSLETHELYCVLERQPADGNETVAVRRYRSAEAGGLK